MKLTVKEMTVFASLGTLMFISKLVMEFLPNIHLLGVLAMTYTLVYRKKALYPIGVYVGLQIAQGLLYGGYPWWIPHIYMWLILWGFTMLLPRRMSTAVAVPVYMTVCGLHGLLYGTLYAPTQALMLGLTFEGTIAWIVAGLPFDVIHAVGNVCLGVLIVPLARLLMQLERSAQRT